MDASSRLCLRLKQLTLLGVPADAGLTSAFISWKVKVEMDGSDFQGVTTTVDPTPAAGEHGGDTAMASWREDGDDVTVRAPWPVKPIALPGTWYPPEHKRIP